MKKFVIELFTLLFDKIIELIGVILKHLKLSLLKVKVTLFTLFMGAFAFNYLIKLSYTQEGKFSFVISQQDVPAAVIVTVVILIIYLIQVDINHIKRKHDLIKGLLGDEKISEAIKQDLVEELKK
jgi:hypothetical protein